MRVEVSIGTASGTWFGVCCCLTGSAWLCLDVSPNHVPEAVRHFVRVVRRPRSMSSSDASTSTSASASAVRTFLSHGKGNRGTPRQIRL